MTDQPDFARDEIASAHLDGEPDATDPTTLDDGLQARVDEFRTVSEALAEPVPTLSDDQRESMLAAALAAADADDSTDDALGEDGTHGAPVTPIDAGRRRRKVWLPPPAVAAAAVVVIALIGIGLIVQGQRGGSSNDLSAASTSADQSAKSTAGGATDSALAATAPPPDLGTFADKAALSPVLGTLDVSTLTPPATTFGTESAAGVAPGETPTTAAADDSVTTSAPPAPEATAPQSFGPVAPDSTRSSTSIDRCDQVVTSTDATLGDRLAVATATVDGRAVLVYSHPVKASEPPATRITVADAETCDVVLAVQR